MNTPRGEFELLRDLRAGAPLGRDVLVGPGDDCAVIRGTDGGDLLFTTDLLVQDRHFVLEGLDPADLGWKALAVSVSDVAAMGGVSRHAVVSVALRPEQTGGFADRLTEGLRECAERYGVCLVGGDTTSSPGPVVVNVALVGAVAAGGAVLRSGARVGDRICVSGALGGSSLGRHLRVSPRQEEARSLVQGGEVHAMIDLSDGLSSDLGHVLDASGVGAEVWGDRVPIHPDALPAARADGRSPLSHALDDGEDFELAFTVTPDRARELRESGLLGTPVAVVGQIVEGSAYLIAPRRGDRAVPLERGGHDHFRCH